MFYKRFYKRRSIYVAVPLLTVTALVFAVLIACSTKPDDNDEFDNVPELSDNLPAAVCSQEKFQEAAGDLKSHTREPSDELTPDDPYLDELQDEDVKHTVKRLESLEKVPVLKWRNELVENMRNEDVKQTIDNLANFDDTSLAATSINEASGNGFFSNMFVTRLSRVRKLFSIGQENPELLVPNLRRAHRKAFVKWPEAMRKRLEDYDKGMAKYSEPDPYFRSKCISLASTYLLAEFGDYDSLPLLSQQYKIHHIWPPPNILPAPVPPAITFYAMHRLAISHPRQGLSFEAVEALDEYLKAAEGEVAQPQEKKVTVWDASYNESDPRLKALGLKNEVLQGQRPMTMPLYPHKFLDGSDMQDYNGIKSEKLDELFEKLDAFVQLAYPLPRG